MKKVSRKANTEYSEIWLQRLSIMINYKYVYKGKLAKKVTSNSIKVWNSDWCKEDINFNEDCLIDYEKKDRVNTIIPENSILLFDNTY